jgi:intracellular multiplication protein IcmP
MSAGGGGQNQADQTSNFFWMLVLAFIGVLAFWWVDHKYITAVVFAIRTYEMDLVLWLSDGYAYVAQFLHLPMPQMYHSLEWWENFIATHQDYSKVTFSELGDLSHDVGQWLRFPVMLILSAGAFILYFKHSTARFIQNYSMKSLRKQEVHNWPQISPIINLDLVSEPLNDGPWAMATLPLTYCKRHGLIEPAIVDGNKIWVVKKGTAYRQFVLQLGQLWTTPEKLPIHLQALLVIFVSHAERNHDVSKKLINQIAASAATGKLNFTGVRESLAKYRNSELLAWLDKRHAYVGSYMATLLEISRCDGVMATADFIWLKPLDRRMWYILNSVGRQTPVTEIAGLFAHWIAEKKLKRPLRAPMVKSAVTGLETAVSEILFVSDDEKWHSNAG